MAKLPATEWIWRDGEFIRWNDAQVHVLSHSMQFGSSLFEGIRGYDSRPCPPFFHLEDNLRPLLKSGKIYRMRIKNSVEDYVAGRCEVFDKTGMMACNARPMALPAYGAGGLVRSDS